MNLLIKSLHPDFKPPRYATVGSAGFDLHAIEGGTCSPDEIVQISLGCAVAVPEGYAMLITSRSGHGLRNGVGVPHGYGLIDSDFRGELFAVLQSKYGLQWAAGDRICQAIIVPVTHARFDLVEELPASERGEGGFGSTGA